MNPRAHSLTASWLSPSSTRAPPRRKRRARHRSLRRRPPVDEANVIVALGRRILLPLSGGFGNGKLVVVAFGVFPESPHCGKRRACRLPVMMRMQPSAGISPSKARPATDSPTMRHACTGSSDWAARSRPWRKCRWRGYRQQHRCLAPIRGQSPAPPPHFRARPNALGDQGVGNQLFAVQCWESAP